MDPEMFSFYPHGVRALLVDDDPEFLKSATIMLSMMQFKVATCDGPSAAARLLKCDKVKDVDVVMADIHEVSRCTFDLRAFVETKLAIPLIYFMTPENRAEVGGKDRKLDSTVKESKFIINKPLDAGEVNGLWRVIMWRKCVLEKRKKSGGGQGSSNANVPYKVIRIGAGSDGQTSNKEDDGYAGYHSRELLDHIDLQSLGRKHVANHLQKLRAKKIQKKNEDGNGGSNSSASAGVGRPKESRFIKSSVQPTFKPLIITGGGGLSTVAAAADDITGGNDVVALPPPPPCHPPLFQEQAGKSVVASAPPPAAIKQPSIGEGFDFTGMPSWPLLFQLPDDDAPSRIAQPEMYQANKDDLSGIVALAVGMEEGDQFNPGAGGGVLSPGEMFFQAIAYQDPFPHLNPFDMQEEVQQQDGDAEIQALFQQPMADQTTGATAGAAIAATAEANEQAPVAGELAADDPFADLPDLQLDHGFPAAAGEAEYHMAAEMVAELMDPLDLGPLMAAYGDDGDGELEPLVIPEGETLTLAQLEALFDEPMRHDVDAPPPPPPAYF